MSMLAHRLEILNRIMARVEITFDDCWLYIGYKDADGYGHYGCYRVHRFVYEQQRGPIPAGLELDHTCRNRACCNPAHLEPCSHLENISRYDNPIGLNLLKTHCPAGHPYTPANTFREAGGAKRRCRACMNAKRAQRRARAAAFARVQSPQMEMRYA